MTVFDSNNRLGMPNLWITEWTLYFKEHRESLVEIYDNLADEDSRKVMFEYVRTIMCNSVYKGILSPSRKKYFECYQKSDKEVFLNIGSYIGDTIYNFIECYQTWNKVYAIECDEEIYERMINNLEILPYKMRMKIDSRMIYLSESNAGQFQDVTLISMDIEGGEKSVLNGLKNIIKINRPVLAICAYHLKTDILEIPRMILSIVNGYKFYFRKYPSAGNLRTKKTELVLYAVPLERLL